MTQTSRHARSPHISPELPLTATCLPVSQSHLTALRKTLKAQKRLARQNTALRAEIAELHADAVVSIQPRPAKGKGKARQSDVGLHSEIARLKAKVRKLERRHDHDRRRIDKVCASLIL